MRMLEGVKSLIENRAFAISKIVLRTVVAHAALDEVEDESGTL